MLIKILSFILTDVDECLNQPCHELAHCNNIVGSYECRCPVGFTGNGKQCIGNVWALYAFISELSIS